jgi:hypothetical protein
LIVKYTIPSQKISPFGRNDRKSNGCRTITKIVICENLRPNSFYFSNYFFFLQFFIIDELGYQAVDKQGAEFPSQVISNRYEYGSIVVITTRAFRDWAKSLNNNKTPACASTADRLASAIIDRLIHHGALVQIKGGGYRVK